MIALFGTTPRRATPFPFHSIGQLPMGCTGALVSSRLVLTAAHCLASMPDNAVTSFRHHSRQGTEPWRPARILARGSTVANPYGQEYADWALLLLDEPSPYQRFRVWAFGTTESHNVINQPAWLVGYSADLPDASVATQCAVRARAGGILYHDCDLKGGASGGPMYIKSSTGERLIIGVQSSETYCGGVVCPSGVEFTIDRANRAVDTLSFIDTLKAYYEQYP